jgi:hypothetical protein
LWSFLSWCVVCKRAVDFYIYMGRNLSMWYRCMFLIGQSVILQSKQGQHGERGALGGVAGDTCVILAHVILLLKSPRLQHAARKSVTIILTRRLTRRGGRGEGRSHKGADRMVDDWPSPHEEPFKRSAVSRVGHRQAPGAAAARHADRVAGAQLRLIRFRLSGQLTHTIVGLR